jgi:general secretion pathway protein F
MPQFRYRAVTQTGALVIGDVRASSREEVLRRIEYLGHWPIEAQTAGKPLLGLGERGRAAPRAREVRIFLRQVALLIGAGLTREAALQTREDVISRALSRFARTLRSDLFAGDNFGEALERHAAIVAPIYVAMVRADETSGKLEAVLQAIVDDRTRNSRRAYQFHDPVSHLPGDFRDAHILVFFLLYVVPQFLVIGWLILSIMSALFSITEPAT